MDQNCGGYRGVGMIGKIVRAAADGQCAVAEELVDMPSGVDNGRHDDPEQGAAGAPLIDSAAPAAPSLTSVVSERRNQPPGQSFRDGCGQRFR